MAAKPVVDRLEERFRSRMTVVRLNVQDAATVPLMRRFGVQYTPTFLLFDGQGEILLRSVGALDPQAVEQQLNDAE